MFNDLVSSIDVITVGEHWSKVALALSTNIMMVIMVFCTTIKWNIFCGSPRKIIPAQWLLCSKHFSSKMEYILWESKGLTTKVNTRVQITVSAIRSFNGHYQTVSDSIGPNNGIGSPKSRYVMALRNGNGRYLEPCICPQNTIKRCLIRLY